MTRKKTTPNDAPALFKAEVKQQPAKKAWQDSSKELRIRNFDPALKKELQEIMKLDKKKMPFESYAVEHLIRNYRADQGLIKQVQQRNTQLHAAVAKLQQREIEMAAFIKSLQEFLKEQSKDFALLFKSAAGKVERLGKEFKKVGTVKATGSKPGRSSRRKTVPKKKGGIK